MIIVFEGEACSGPEERGFIEEADADATKSVFVVGTATATTRGFVGVCFGSGGADSVDGGVANSAGRT